MKILETKYEIDLGSDLKWEVCSSPKAEDFVDRFALIQGLKPCNQNGQKRLVFAEIEEISKFGLDIDVSTTFKVNGSKIHYSSDGKQIVYEIIKKHDNFGQAMSFIEASYPIYQEVINCGGMPLHAGLIVYQGKGIALAGSSGAGKSTCCQRAPFPWQVKADDEVLYRPENGGFRIHPLPTWSEFLEDINIEKSWNIKSSYPLSALFFLEPADVDEAVILPKSQASLFVAQSAIQVFTRLFGDSYQEQFGHKRKIFNNACKMVDKIPVYQLKHSLNGEFWKKIEIVMGERLKPSNTD